MTDTLIDGSELDLPAYLRRVAHDGATRPTLPTLAALQWQHASQVAFENLTPLLDEPVRLDLSSLQNKLVAQARGGYCFEQNLLLAAVLQRLGFAVTGLAARVLWGQAPGACPPRTHMALKVTAAGNDYLVDVGFGGLTPTAPLRLDSRQAQPTPHESFRLRQQGGTWRLQAELSTQWHTLYQFDLQPQRISDYQMANWYVSHHPQSRFVTSLVASRPDRGCRHNLVNGRYTVRFADDRCEQRTRLHDVDAVIDLLARVFGVRRDYDAAARRRIREVISAD